MGESTHTSADRSAPRTIGAGLCDTCAWQRVVTSGRGSVFSLCRRSLEDERWERYPRVPVLRCVGYERSVEEPAAPGPESSS